MGTPLTRDRALGGAMAANPPAHRVPSPLEVVAQQAMALQAQINALVGMVLTMLEQQSPQDEPTGPAMPPVFGGPRSNGEDTSS